MPRLDRTALIAAAAALTLVFAGSAVGKKKVQHVGASTTVETSTLKGRKSIVVRGVVQSSLPRCERQRSVLLYQAGPSGDITGGAIGHAVTEGGSDRGQFTIRGFAPKKIRADRRFIVETVGRRVKVKGAEIVCKRSVSVEFPGTFS